MKKIKELAIDWALAIALGILLGFEAARGLTK